MHTNAWNLAVLWTNAEDIKMQPFHWTFPCRLLLTGVGLFGLEMEVVVLSPLSAL